LQSGLSRLAEAASTIDELNQQAQVQQALLAQKQEEADRALTDIQVMGKGLLHVHTFP
jgi:multidrug resistance efflux pump